MRVEQSLAPAESNSDKQKKVQGFYDAEASRYVSERYTADSCESLSYRSRKAIVLRFLNDGEPSTLDVGCGPGILTRELLARGRDVVSVDISVEMLVQARQNTDSGAVNWLNADIDSLPFVPEAFDCALAIGVIAYANDAPKVLRGIAAALRPGGTLILQCSNWLCPTAAIVAAKDSLLHLTGIRRRSYDFELMRFRYGQLASLLESVGFEVIDHGRYDFRLPFLESLAPRLAVSIAAKLQSMLENSQIWGWVGEGYVIKAKRRS